MSNRRPRFEIVQSKAGWFARFIATNGKEVWRTSEVYSRRPAAEHAMWLIRDAATDHYDNRGETEVREADER